MNGNTPGSSNGSGNPGANGHAPATHPDRAALRREVSQAVTQAREHVAADIQTLVSAAGSLGRAELSGAAERITRYVSQLSDAACEATRRGKEQVQTAAAKTGEYVKANPLQSVGLALVLGFIVGRLTARR